MTSQCQHASLAWTAGLLALVALLGPVAWSFRSQVSLNTLIMGARDVDAQDKTQMQTAMAPTNGAPGTRQGAQDGSQTSAPTVVNSDRLQVLVQPKLVQPPELTSASQHELVQLAQYEVVQPIRAPFHGGRLQNPGSITKTSLLQGNDERNASLSLGAVTCSKGDGFGAQYQCKMSAFAKARFDGQCYNHTPFARKGFHGLPFDADQFTGLKSDPACSGKPENIGAPLSETYYTKKVRDELRALYWSTLKPHVDNSCEVAVHVRRGDVSLAEAPERYTSNSKLHSAISQNFANKKVCIFSEGNQTDFGPVQQLANVEFKLNGATDQAFHALVSAPELVIAKSSFSYAAGILNKGKVDFIESFWHLPLKDWNQLPLEPSSKVHTKHRSIGNVKWPSTVEEYPDDDDEKDLDDDQRPFTREELKSTPTKHFVAPAKAMSSTQPIRIDKKVFWVGFVVTMVAWLLVLGFTFKAFANRDWKSSCRICG